MGEGEIPLSSGVRVIFDERPIKRSGLRDHLQNEYDLNVDNDVYEAADEALKRFSGR